MLVSDLTTVTPSHNMLLHFYNLVPSLTAYLFNSRGNTSLTHVCISLVLRTYLLLYLPKMINSNNTF